MEWNIKELVREYAPPKDDELLWTEEEAELIALKRIVNNLPHHDRTFLIMYAELGSLRMVAKELDVSHSAAIKKMDQIRLRVLSEFYKEKAAALNNSIKRKIRNKEE